MEFSESPALPRRKQSFEGQSFMPIEECQIFSISAVYTHVHAARQPQFCFTISNDRGSLEPDSLSIDNVVSFLILIRALLKP